MTFINKPSDYDSVRAALDVTLDKEVLPDNIINLPIYQGTAEDQVKTADPHWQTRTGEDWQHLVNAAILYTAALVAPFVPEMVMEYFGEYRYHRQPSDFVKLAALLRQRADGEVAAVVSDIGVLTSLPQMFGVADGKRARKYSTLKNWF